DRAAETASHLEDCRECQSLAADLGFVAQKLIEWQIEAPEPKLSERLTEELDGRQREKPNNLLSKHGAQVSSLKPRLLWTGGAVAVFVVVLAMSMSKMMMRNRIAFEGSAGLAPASSMPTAPQSSATPHPSQGSVGKLQKEKVEGEEGKVPANNGPMIVRTAELTLATNKFDQARAAVEEILKRHQGYVGELHVNTPTGS